MKLTVSLFGKLRIFSDFIEPIHRVRFGEELREWLTGGSRSGEILSDPRFAFRIAWPRASGRRVLVASIWASSDAVGRSCPFALFCELPARKLKVRSLAEWPLALTPVWDGLRELARTANGQSWLELERDQSTPLEIQAAVRDARLQWSPEKGLGARLEDDLARRPARDFLAALLGAEAETHWPPLALRLAAAADNLPRDEAGLALRLPAGRGLPVESVAAFWLEIVGGLSGHRQGRPPAIVLPAGDARERGLLILFRDLIGADFELLFGRGGHHPYLVDLARPTGTGASGRGPDVPESLLARCRDATLGASSALDLARLPLTQWVRSAG